MGIVLTPTNYRKSQFPKIKSIANNSVIIKYKAIDSNAIF